MPVIFISGWHRTVFPVRFMIDRLTASRSGSVMSQIPGPAYIRLHLDHTPSPKDPEGASYFYQALGTFVMAWGRLEAHFLACLLDVIQTPALGFP